MSRITFVSLIALQLTLFGCASSSGTKSNSTTDGSVVTTYEDPNYFIRLTYPGDWQEQSIPFMLRPKGTIIVLIAPSDVSGTRMPPTLSFVAHDAPATEGPATAADLDALQQQMIEKAKGQFGDFNLVDSSVATLGGEPARRVTYLGSKMGVALEVMNVIALHGGRQYGAAYSADPEIFEQHRPAVERVLASVRWMK